jgi:peptidoglycan hydrolase-like protein with peptidoglycan-binding domain
MRPNESFVGQPVRSLQTMLRVIGQASGQEITLIPDGFYGNNTRDAVSEFQRKRGIPATGVADENTWQRIVAEYPDALTRVGPAEPLQLILNPGHIIRSGETHPYLFLIQAMLAALQEAYGSIPAPPMTGVLDAPTGDSIASFQRLSTLPETGEIDKVTWKHLALHYPLAVNRNYSRNRMQR